MSFMIINSKQESSYILPFDKESAGKCGQVGNITTVRSSHQHQLVLNVMRETELRFFLKLL